MFVGTLTDQCRELPGGELTSLDRVLDAMGRDFYDAVASDPEAAVLDAECEEMCYLFAHLYCERFGEFPETGQHFKIS